MTFLGLYVMYKKFKKEKEGFNPFKKYTKEELEMFKKVK